MVKHQCISPGCFLRTTTNAPPRHSGHTKTLEVVMTKTTLLFSFYFSLAKRGTPDMLLAVTVRQYLRHKLLPIAASFKIFTRHISKHSMCLRARKRVSKIWCCVSAVASTDFPALLPPPFFFFLLYVICKLYWMRQPLKPRCIRICARVHAARNESRVKQCIPKQHQFIPSH